MNQQPQPFGDSPLAAHSFPVSGPAADTDGIDASSIAAVENQHDLTLPAWGPYTKRYIGISHVPSPGAGLRFDLSVFPGQYRRKATPPNVLFESGYYPWEATPDLGFFSFRHEIEWKDQVYSDISYSKLDDKTRLIRAECVNRTDLPQTIVLHFMASMNFPSESTLVELPPGAVWVSAADYKSLNFARSTPKDNLVTDGKMLGEIREGVFVGGSGLGEGFASTAGDTACYTFEITEAIPDLRLVIRYRIEDGGKTTLQFKGLLNSPVELAGNGSLQARILSLGPLPAGAHELTIVADGGSSVELDGFALVPASQVEDVLFKKQTWEPTPEMISGPTPNSLILKYRDAQDYYGLRWDYDTFQIREFLCRDLDIFFPKMIHDHVRKVLTDDESGHFTNVFLRPITLPPRSSRVVHGTICNGTRTEVEHVLATTRTQEVDDAIYAQGRAGLPDLKPAPQGEPFEFSQQRMAATLLCNVVYPIYTQRSYIRHNTPGRWWDCLYTWDSGFIGLGLAELDVRRAFECLNTYLNEPGAQSAFIHHGSMVPVQFYVFLDLWNRTQSQDFLKYAYPRLKQYYEFYLGRIGSSSMRKFQSGLLSSFDYFYNSGGWDDYPAQGKGERLAPVVNSAHGIRIAKIMTMAAEALERLEEVRIYEEDIASLTEALQKHSWDEETGYFGYVQHDESGEAAGITKFKNLVNYNMGMDGLSPLISGIGTAKQTAKMLERLMSPERIWSRIGLSAVDQSAPYYSNDGYWNGTVWMPHQWFFWKTMLDLGEGGFAWQIGKRALEVWRTEVDDSYHCMEHFIIESGRGAGWNEFGGLSTPVLKWYSAYCRPGTLTTGFNTWIVRQQFTPENTGLDATIKISRSGTPVTHCSMIACMNPEFDYQVVWNGTPITPNVIAKGLLDIRLPAQSGTGTLTINKVE